ncbi:hypothetical protein EDB85DRAFT_1896146 [Lactarius pseudohatsudake]|nr:hypothetical protein EDB85DRAFT_1896146 [Lactarius pseudohatsudake]
MDRPTRNLLKLFPNELITKTLAMLHCRDLASCTQVCKRMVDIVSGSTLLQYRLELGKSGMEDGPLSTLSIPERRERLRAYNDAWKHLRWSACIELPAIRRYDMDIAPGDILTFVPERDHKIIFVQIPSKLRSIPMRQWELSFPFVLHQYALDPREDILVLYEWRPHPSGNYRFHSLSLTTGEPHPRVAVSLHSPHYLMRSANSKNFVLNMAQNYLAILDPMYELCVYNWKTDQKVLSIASDALQSVSFLPDNRFLLVTTRAADLRDSEDPILKGLGKSPVLVMYDLDQASRSQRENDSSLLTVFSLKLGEKSDSYKMALYYRPNIHSYSDDVAVPFFRSPSDQLIALKTSGFCDDIPLPPRRVLLIPIVRLTSHIDGPGPASGNAATRYIPWNDWGATSSRWVPGPSLAWRPSFHGSLSGSRFIPGFIGTDFIRVWDFSRAEVAQLEPQPCDRKSLPHVKKQVAPPIRYDTVAISEDALICQSSVISPTHRGDLQ